MTEYDEIGFYFSAGIDCNGTFKSWPINVRVKLDMLVENKI